MPWMIDLRALWESKTRRGIIQGPLDGLCVPYAIVNAYHQCEIDVDWLGQDIFNIACSAISGWPDTLWEGTTFPQMRTMLRACQKALKAAYEGADCHYPIDVDYPFWKNEPRSNSVYWDRFEEIFSEKGALCGIVGMEKPNAHWFAFRKRDRTLITYNMTDSSRGGMQKIKIKDVWAGVYRKKEYVINRKELIVFYET